MIVELAAIVCGSLTVITISALSFVRRVQDREAITRAEADVVIYPYHNANDEKDTCCVCGAEYDNGLGDETRLGGPSAPEACRDGAKCPAFPEPHLHIMCFTCNSTYFMETRPLSNRST